jgi:hypothetical protein
MAGLALARETGISRRAAQGRRVPSPLRLALSAFALVLGLAAPALAGGTLVWEKAGTDPSGSFGSAVANAGDINGDGRDDVLVVVGIVTPGGRVHVLSGLDGSVLRTFTGNSSNINAATLGAVASAGDFNSDGTPDLLLGARAGYNLVYGEHGYIIVVSGAPGCDGRSFAANCGSSLDTCVLQHICGSAGGDTFGGNLANVGDVNGDGVADILAGLPGTFGASAGAAKLFSGATGALLFSGAGGAPPEGYGSTVAAVGDMTRDGVPDFAIGAPGKKILGEPYAGQILVYSGKTRSVYRSFKGKGGQALGRALAGPGRINGDGATDIMFGISGKDKDGLLDVGQVRVRSGKDGTKLFHITGATAGLQLGVAVAGLGDVNGDSVNDFAAGTYPGGVNGMYGRVVVYSGKTGAELFSYTGPDSHDGTGYSIGSADVTGDGRPELIIGSPEAGSATSFPGWVRAFSIN